MCTRHILKLAAEHLQRARRHRMGSWGSGVLMLAALAGLLLLRLAAPAAANTEVSPEIVANARSPGQGTDADHERPTVRLARPTWDTGWFQAEIAAAMIRELGYRVDGPSTMEIEDFYRSTADGQVDLWVNGWFPLHDVWLDGRQSITPVGFEVRGGALQGYLADRATVEALGIETLADLADPSVAEVFDTTGDGVADLIGCNRAWTCGPIVDHHLDAYGLTGTVTQVQGDYGPLMKAAIDRYRSGEPVLFYTFTPNWTTGQLVPGVDVVWLPAPFPSLPEDLADQEPLTTVPGVTGCPNDPCALGFAPNDIRSVANTDFLAANPAIEALLEHFEIPLDDISDQNARMIRGEDDAGSIDDHAAQWIAENRDRVDTWMEAAIDANDAAGLPPLTPSAGGASGGGFAATPGMTDVGPIRVVTRLAPPFVSHDGSRYQGFSVELLDMVAEDIGADIDLYAVNTSAKLIDDVNRGEADVGVGALAITARREQVVDFSQPYFDSGLQILVADRNDGFLGGRFGAVARAIFSSDLVILLLVLLTVLVAAAHVIWLTERNSNPDFPQSYRAGIWESLWWAAVTATTVGYGDKTPKGPAGRIFGLFWMFSGLFVLAYFTAGIATTFTIDELNRGIDDPNELRGRAVGAAADSTAVDYLGRQGIPATEFPSAEEAYDALLDADIDAVVHDAAILQHFVATNERGGAAVSGLVFAELGFGFALQPGSELTEAVNRSLLELIESGDFDELHDKWFGAARTGEN